MKPFVCIFLVLVAGAASGSGFYESSGNMPGESADYRHVNLIDLMLDAEEMEEARIESEAWVEFISEDVILLRRPDKGKQAPLFFSAVEGDELSRADRLYLRDSCAADSCKLFFRGVVGKDVFGDPLVKLNDIDESAFSVSHRSELLELVEKGVVEVETRDLPVDQVPEVSQLAPGTLGGFRGSVSIREGESADVTFIELKDGYVVQNLPFRIKVEDVGVEFNDSGKPRSLSSKVVLTDKATGESEQRAVRDDHPLHYKGYDIVQSSFGDGGTELRFNAWQLAGKVGTSHEREGKVHSQRTFEFGGEKYTLEFRDFSTFNVNPTKGPDGRTENTNFGPSVTFRLRNAAGEAIEYENYFQPVEFDGTKYFLSGVTKQVGGQQQFLFIPADRNNSLETFMAFYARLKDREALGNIVADLIGQTTEGGEQGDGQVQNAVRSVVGLVETFVNEGFSVLEKRVDQSLAERGLIGEQAEQARKATLRVVQSVLMRAYMKVVEAQGVKDFSEKDAAFFEDALDVITVIPNYGSPIYLAPTGFNQIQSSGLVVVKN